MNPMDITDPCDQNCAANGCNVQAEVPCPLDTSSEKIDLLTSDKCRELASAGCPVAEQVQNRLKFEALLAELSARFVNARANQVDSQIEWGLRRIVEHLQIDRSGFGEVSADGHQFVVTHSYQLPGLPSAPKGNLHDLFPSYAEMIRDGKVVRVPNDLPPEATAEREYCRQIGLRHSLTIPLAVMGAVVGGIGFASFRSTRELPDELIPRLRLVGDIFTNALARKRADVALLNQEKLIRNSHRQLRDLASKLLHAQEQERRRIAREMHDDWTQRLAVLGIEAAKLKPHISHSQAASELLQAICDELVSLSEDVHGLSRQLHPAILEDLGLVEALRSECASYARRTGFSVQYIPQDISIPIPADAALCAYRVVQESLRNAAKHSGTQEAFVSLAVLEDELVLRVRDQGNGFVPHEMQGAGIGLSSMEERVNLVRGKLSILTAPGTGTTVEVRLPITESCSP